MISCACVVNAWPECRRLATCRESTALQRKLEVMAQQIGNFGLAAAVFSLAAMAGQFTWHTFYVEGQAWDYKFLSEYLSYVITAITIVVSESPYAMHCRNGLLLLLLDPCRSLACKWTCVRLCHPCVPPRVPMIWTEPSSAFDHESACAERCVHGALTTGSMQCAGGGHPGGPPAGGDHCACVQREAHAGRQQPGAQSGGRRDHGLRHHHLHRQDRHVLKVSLPDMHGCSAFISWQAKVLSTLVAHLIAP